MPGVVESLRLITRPACERIVRYAFELARRQGRKRVTFCHKADVMPLSDGLFLAVAREVADDFPFVGFEEMHVDALCLQLALDPSALRRAGDGKPLRRRAERPVCRSGRRAGPGARREHRHRYAVFEAVHGSAPDIAGKGAGQPDRADPLGGADARTHRPARIAARIEAAVRETLAAGKGLTRDLGGDGNTATITQALIRNL